MKRFFFANEAAHREYLALPGAVQDEFGKDLRRIQYGNSPQLPIKHLQETVGTGVIELIINGNRAFRCIYVAKFDDRVVVLHSFSKTTNAVDRKAMQLARQRLKAVQQAMAEG